MKQVKLFFLLTSLVCTFSCGNDNGGDPDVFYQPYAYMQGVFPNPALGRELILIYNNDTLTNKKVNFVSRSTAKPQAILTLENVINSEAKSVFTVDLIESENPDNGVIRLLFFGVYTTTSRSIRYSGFIEPLLMLLELEEE